LVTSLVPDPTDPTSHASTAHHFGFVDRSAWRHLVACAKPDPAVTLPAREGPPIASAQTWGYQLQGIDVRSVPDGIDLLVVDYSKDGTQNRALSASDVEALRRKPGGGRRIILCYLSIGEAERYRYYWQPFWNVVPPAWLGAENPSWRGNFVVQYWQSGWQSIIVGGSRGASSLVERLFAGFFKQPKAYLDQILEAGFDGVYLDRVDAYEKAGETRPTAKADMIAFVETIATYARKRRPGFLVVPQNGEALLDDARYRTLIDAIGKEDLLYGENGDGIANSTDDVRFTTAALSRAKNAGRPVFVIEYLKDPALQRIAAGELSRQGFIGLFAERTLSQPPILFEQPIASSTGN
jgi:cysteinyl-tRNA synthetase, unknown class